VTNLLAALIAGLIGAALYGWFVTGSPSPLLTTRGAAAGLVAMLAAAPFVPPWSALVIGLIAGLLVPLSAYALERLRVMDPTMIVSTFAVPGLWGVLALGIFADGHAGVGWNLVGAQNFLGVERQGVTGMLPTPPFTPDMPGQIQAQLFGSLAIAVFAFAAAWAIFYALRKIGRPKTPGIVPPPPPPPPPPVNKTKPAELPQ
jgi:Amt family ammonium transporter